MVVKHVDLRFNNVNYKQSDGLVNGSPPVLNHIFVGYYVARLLKNRKISALLNFCCACAPGEALTQRSF